MRIELKFGKKKYLLLSDKYNFILAEGTYISKKDKSERLINPQYYTKFSSAIDAILENTIKMSDSKTLKELKEEISLIKNEIKEVFKV